MLYALALVIVASLVFVIIRAGATALELTGLSRDAAQFQALSAFFGAGFTTGESELVVNHPVRRRVIRDLIVIGNIGILSVIGTVVVTATRLDFEGDPAAAWSRIALVGLGLALLWGFSRTPIPTWLIDRSVSAILKKTDGLHSLDYEALLRVRAGYVIEILHLASDHWLAGKPLRETCPGEMGVSVLGIVRADCDYLGAPCGDDTLLPDDTLILYGRRDSVRELLSAEHAAQTTGDAGD